MLCGDRQAVCDSLNSGSGQYVILCFRRCLLCGGRCWGGTVQFWEVGGVSRFLKRAHRMPAACKWRGRTLKFRDTSGMSCFVPGGLWCGGTGGGA